MEVPVVRACSLGRPLPSASQQLRGSRLVRCSRRTSQLKVAPSRLSVVMKMSAERKQEVLTKNLRKNLGQGDMGSEVTRLQEALVGYGELAEKNITGFYGPLTERAVKRWQLKHELPETGYWGPSTRALHNRMAEVARQQYQQQALQNNSYASNSYGGGSQSQSGMLRGIGGFFGGRTGGDRSTYNSGYSSAGYYTSASSNTPVYETPAVSVQQRSGALYSQQGAAPPPSSAPSQPPTGAVALGLAVVGVVAMMRLPALRDGIMGAGRRLFAGDAPRYSYRGGKVYKKLKLLNKPVFRARDVGISGIAAMEPQFGQQEDSGFQEMDENAFSRNANYDDREDHPNRPDFSRMTRGSVEQMEQHPSHMRQQHDGGHGMNSGFNGNHLNDRDLDSMDHLTDIAPAINRRGREPRENSQRSAYSAGQGGRARGQDNTMPMTTQQEVEYAREQARLEMLQSSALPPEKSHFWRGQQKFNGTPQINYGSPDGSTSKPKNKRSGGGGGGGAHAAARGGGATVRGGSTRSRRSYPDTRPRGRNGGGGGGGGGGSGGGFSRFEGSNGAGRRGGSSNGFSQGGYHLERESGGTSFNGSSRSLNGSSWGRGNQNVVAKEPVAASAGLATKIGKAFGFNSSRDAKAQSFMIAKKSAEQVKNGFGRGGKSALKPPAPLLKGYVKSKRAAKKQEHMQQEQTAKLQKMVYELEQRIERAVKDSDIGKNPTINSRQIVRKHKGVDEDSSLESRLSRAESLVEDVLAITDELQEAQQSIKASWAVELQQLTENIQAAKSVAESVLLQNTRLGNKRNHTDISRVESAVEAQVRAAVNALEMKVEQLEEQGLWDEAVEDAVESALSGHYESLKSIAYEATEQVHSVEARTSQLEERIAMLEAALAAPPGAPAIETPSAPPRVEPEKKIERPPPKIIQPSTPPPTIVDSVTVDDVLEMEDTSVLEPAPPKEDISVMDEGKAIFLQGFNWESHNLAWFNVLSSKAHEIAQAGFAGVWMPPSSQSLAPQGYLPSDLYCLNSAYGSETDLKNCIANLHENGLLAIADIVINHRSAPQRGRGGAWNRYEGQKMAWEEWAITTDNPHFCGTGNRATGDDFPAAPNIDHTNETVQKDLSEWLRFLRNDVGYDGWRFDFAKGYGGQFVRRYIEESDPLFSVGEYWDSLSYAHGKLDYDQGGHRQRTIDWIDRTDGLSQAFDFTTKGILQDACRNSEYWRLKDPQGKPPGVMGLWPSRAMTFLDNHDTGSTQAHWPFPGDKILEGYAYILTHPGMPCVMWDHFFDWGNEKRNAITRLIQLRRENNITSRSEVHIDVADGSCYGARIDDSIAVRLGRGNWHPGLVGGTWEEALRGDGFFIWKKVSD